MKGKLIGIGAITSILALLMVATVIAMGGEFFSAVNFQILIVVFTISIVMSGTYLLNAHSSQTNATIKLGIGVLGLALIIFSALVSFNIIPILTTYNWLITLGILYVLLVQLQLLQWGNSPSIISKICAFIVILTNLFLIIFFIAKWRYSAISSVIDIAVVLSVVAFLIGVIANKKKVVEAA
ncbi:MAG: hypothetical protein GQ574_02405 [Crocinitomix sp.]|nr:hypothetical protein [Crocinitomix sp.]